MQPQKAVFLFDCDNTLLNHDQVTADLRRHLTRAVGPEKSQRYWHHFETLRSEIGYADYLGALQRYRIEHPREPQLIDVSFFLLSYPFANRLYPGSLDAVSHVSQWGTPVILSDGDVVFQPRKVYKAGLYERFQGNVLIYVHKEDELEDVEAKYPAEHYTMVDDKIRLLTAMKKIWGDRLTTVFVRQGHYALDTDTVAKYPPADLTIEHIAEMTRFGPADFRLPGH